MGTERSAAEAAELRARAVRLAGDADALQDALRAVERRAAAMVWSGPVREAFGGGLRAGASDLARAAEALRAEADRLVREAVRCEQEATAHPRWPR